MVSKGTGHNKPRGANDPILRTSLGIAPTEFTVAVSCCHMVFPYCGPQFWVKPVAAKDAIIKRRERMLSIYLEEEILRPTEY